MTTAADYLHAQVFGRHEHLCPRCKRMKPCSDQYDCQNVQICDDCNYELDEEEAA